MSLTRCSSPSPISSPIPPISLFSLVFIFSLLSFHLLDMNINKPCPPIIISHPATSVSTVSSQFTQFSFFRPTYPTISPPLFFSLQEWSFSFLANNLFDTHPFPPTLPASPSPLPVLCSHPGMPSSDILAEQIENVVFCVHVHCVRRASRYRGCSEGYPEV